MSAQTLLIASILVGVCSSHAIAELPKLSGDSGLIESSEKAINEAKDKREKALLRKKLGDYFVSQEDYERAAEEFMKALTLSPSPFTEQERLQMAITLSWADRLEDAGRVLRSILAENPENSDARIEFAKVL